MATSHLERCRASLEELETLERNIADALDNKPKAYKGAALTDFHVSACMVHAQTISESASLSWQDPLGARAAELQSMVGGGASDAAPNDMMAAFYQRLEESRAAHRMQASPSVSSAASVGVTSALADAALATLASFSAEELYGRYVDLAPLFEGFCNLPHVRDARFTANTDGRAALPDDAADVADAACADYAGYLARLADFHATLPVRVKYSKSYRRYVAALSRYMLHFLQRRAPLVDAFELVRGWESEFISAWNKGEVAGWIAGSMEQEPAGEADESHQTSAGVSTGLVDLSTFESADAILESLGPDGCKAQLQGRRLKAGGSPQERAERLWLIKEMAPDQYPKKIRAAAVADGKSSEPPKQGTESTTSSSAAIFEPAHISGNALAVRLIDPSAWGTGTFGGPPTHSVKTAAWTEFVALQCARVLADVLADTRRRVQFRATRTHAELQQDRQTEEAEVSEEPGAGGAMDEDDETGAPIYNPLNIPLGWDGKPIPYWLYRLHGLNIEYTCEICGGAVYRGRRDFDRHFQEWRHASGMRALGVPNTKHFHDITKIQDARELHERMKSVMANETWRAEGPAGEEYEDSEGNVLARKTYEDLARQGLL